MNILMKNNNSQKNHNGLLQPYLSFSLKSLLFAITMDKIKEIIGLDSVEIYPIYAPSFIKGVVYLYNKIIPIYEISSFFNISLPPNEKFRSLIILSIKSEVFGIIIPDLPEIIELNASQVLTDPTPDIAASEYIEGIAETKEGSFIILNIEKLLQIPRSNHEHQQ